MGVAFRQRVGAIERLYRPKERFTSSFSRTIRGVTHVVRQFEDIETGEQGFYDIYAETKHIPRAFRPKRDASDMLSDDGGASDEDAIDEHNDDQEMAAEWTEEERAAAAKAAASKKKKKTAAKGPSAAKKQKKSADRPVRRAARAEDRNEHNNNNEAETSADTSRRSTRVTSGSARAARASAASTSASTRREPIIREDQEENHITQEEAIRMNESYNLRRTSRAPSDELNSLSDRMNHFEIKSEAGSGESLLFLVKTKIHTKLL